MRNRRSALFAAAPVLFLLFFSLGTRLMQSAAETPDDSPLTSVRKQRTGVATPKIVIASPETQKQLETLVIRQLTAIRKRDYVAALECALPTRRSQWTPASFQQMIESNFTTMPKSLSQRFQTARSMGNSATMMVRITGEESESACIYSFQQTNERWYIFACSALLSPDRGGIASFPYPGGSMHHLNGDLDSVRRRNYVPAP